MEGSAVPTHCLVNGALQRCHDVVVACLRDDGPLNDHVATALLQLFLNDVETTYFFMHYIAVKPSWPEGQAVAGRWGRVPSGGASMHFVANLNHFGDCGGFDAILRRLRQQVRFVVAVRLAG